MSAYEPCPICGAVPSEYVGTVPERVNAAGKVVEPARQFVRVGVVHNLTIHGFSEIKRREGTPTSTPKRGWV